MMNNTFSTLETEAIEIQHYANRLEAKDAIAPSIYPFVKRAMDIVGATVGIVLLLPAFLLIALFIKMNDHAGSIFFRQNRIGHNSNVFKIYKFRTMVHQAEEKLKADPELYAKFVANGYKLDQDEDPRITKIGRILRKTSLDELPQLLNVLKGDMSLVGPRPVVREELQEYGDKVVDFLSVKPGVTGYWQISGRSDVGYPERVDLELFYVYNFSILMDIKILFKTVLVVLLRRGAC